MSLTDFERYLRLEMNRSRHTVEAYLRDVSQYCAWTGSTPEALLSDHAVEPNDIRDWIGTLAMQGEKPASLRRKTQSLRAFFRWGMTIGLCHANPAADVVLAKLPRHLPDIAKVSEIEEIIATHPTDTIHDLRVLMALKMLYTLGLRQAELLSVTDSDIRQGAGGAEIRITGKGNKERILPLPPQLAEDIRQWQRERDRHYDALPEPKPLLAARHGALSKGTLYTDIHNVLAGTSAARKSPHILRHSCATALLNNGANIDAVRQLLGHASLATTQIYTHLSPRELRQAYNHAHPRASSKPDSED